MGNTDSRPLYHKLSSNLPEGKSWSFTSDEDRAQFIYAVITVITQNGSIDLQQYNFRLLYSRKENDRVVARIVAEKEGVIKAKAEPDSDGKDQAEAFKALRKDIEVKLEHILANVPTAEPVAVEAAGPSRVPRAGGSTLPSDAPPAYGSDVKLSSKK